MELLKKPAAAVAEIRRSLDNPLPARRPVAFPECAQIIELLDELERLNGAANKGSASAKARIAYLLGIIDARSAIAAATGNKSIFQ